MVWQIDKKVGTKVFWPFVIKLSLLAAALMPAALAAQPLFEDDTDAIGGPFHVGETWGAAWGDFNGDLYPDLFASNHGALNSIVRNNGDGTFAEIVDQADAERIWTGTPDSDIHGGSWADFDNDGDQDLFVSRSSVGARFQLMENNGLGGFTEESGPFGIGPFGGGRLPVLFDYDNDGNLDVALAGNRANGLVLFRWNPPTNRYVVQTNEAGIFNKCLLNTAGFASDLFNTGTLNYVCVNEREVPERVYDTDTFPFTDVTSSLDRVGTNTDAVLADFNNDSLIDIMVNRGRVRPSGASRVSSTRLEAWFSVGGRVAFQDSMTFSSTGPISVNVFARSVGEPDGLRIGSSGAIPSSLPVVLDPNDPANHGLPSILPNQRAVYVGYDQANEEWTIILSTGGTTGIAEGAYISVDGVDISEPTTTGLSPVDGALAPTFLLNDGSRLVSSGSRGIGAVQCGGIAAADFDNDMDIDVYMACRDSVSNFANRLYLNDGTGTFSLSQQHGAEGIIGSGIESLAGTAGMAITADYNVDGFMDIFVTNGNRLFPLLSKDGFSGGGPGQFFRNLANNGNNWLQIDLQGVTSNRDGFGAKVFVTANGVTQYREQNGQYHRWSQDSRRIHFGLGPNTSADVTIEWPDGTTDNFTNVASDQLYLAVQGGAITPRTPTLNPPSVSVSTDGVAEGETANVAISIFPPSSDTVTVEYQTVDSSATAALDYTPVTGIITFAPLETEKLVSVPSLMDVEDEGDELFSINLSNPFNVVLNQPQGLVEIEDDDDSGVGGPVVAVSDSTVIEGDLAEFTISVSENPTQNVIVEFETVDGTAIAEEDYLPRTGRVTFRPNEPLSVIRRITTLNDGVVESSESFGLRLFGTQNANVLDNSATATLLDIDTVVPEISIDDVSVDEGLVATLTVTLSEITTETVLVDFASSDISATAGLDYTAVSGSLEFLPGEQSQDITLTTLQDTESDGDETLSVILSNADNATLSDASGIVTIIDDEAPIPLINIDSVSTVEGELATLTVSLSVVSAAAVSVDYVTVDGTALANSDYISAGGTLVFAPGELSKTLVLATVGDIEDESQESFGVQLSGLVGGLPGQLVSTVTIEDDDDGGAGGPVISISDTTVSEGGLAEFTISISENPTQNVIVEFETVDDTAIAEEDYLPRTGRVTFRPDEPLSAIRRITTLNDGVVENSESFGLRLFDTQNGNVLDNTATATLIDIDTVVPEISINDVSVDEGLVATLTVTLSEPTTETVLVDFASNDISATAGQDYTATSGSLEFLPGEQSQNITLSTLQDVDSDGDETLAVTLSNPDNATLLDASGVVTIIDDEAPTPVVDIDSVSITEGGSGTLTVSLSTVSANTVSVDFATADGTALANSDYVPAGGTLVFAPGELSRTLVLTTISDIEDETLENFSVQLSGLVGGLPGQLVSNVTIEDDDDGGVSGPVVTVSGNAVSEGEQIDFTFTLSEASTAVVSVDFSTADGTAEAGSDYVERPIGRVTFQPGGPLSLIRRVTTLEDVVLESDETVFMQLSNPVNLNILDASGIGTILDNDAPVDQPSISISDGSIEEGGRVDFVITLSEASTEIITVDFGTSDGTAQAGSDYIERLAGRVTFQPGGPLSMTRRITTLEDSALEADETFIMQLSNPVNADILDGTGTGTILDNDAPVNQPDISISDGSIDEGGRVDFVITLSEASTEVVTVDFGTSDGTAQAGTDYIERLIGRVTFQPGGPLSMIRRITTLEDFLPESEETFIMQLSNPVNAGILDSTGIGTILDND